MFLIMIRCPICGKEFKTWYNLKKHFKRKCGNNLKICPICGKEFKYLVIHCSKFYHSTGCVDHLKLYYLLSKSEGRVSRLKRIVKQYL